MFWKIYAVIYLLMILIGTLVLIPMIGPWMWMWAGAPEGMVLPIGSWNLASWMGVIEGILLAIGVFVFVYKKNFLNKEAWKFIFIVILLGWITDIIIYTTNLQLPSFFKVNAFEYGVGEFLFSIIISIPALVAIYKMGFLKKNS